LHGERDDSAEALSCWARVVGLEPDRAGAHNGLGWALQEGDRPAEAEQHFRTALRLGPELPGAHLNLGGLHEERGNLEEAETCFRAAIRAQPAHALAHARLATLRRGKLPDADRAAIEERLADPQLDDTVRSHLLFALAQVFDGQGEFARAADYLRRANALQGQRATTRHRSYSREEHERFVERVVNTFDSNFLARRRETGHHTRRPVFVFGLPRSGTTLVEQVLASHSRVFGGGELRLVRRTFEAIPAALGRTSAPLDCVADLDARAIRLLADEHLKRLADLDGGRSDRVVDKMPDNYLYLGLITVLFPNAVLIHCRRDLRDVAVSCWMTDFRSIRWANDPEHIASRFQQYRRLMDHWRALVPMHEVRYEAMVSDQEGVTRSLLAACGLEWEPACLDFHRTRRQVRTASLTQVRQPLYRQSVARWKNYESALAELFAGLPCPD
jgi:hypothetical protein